MRRDAHTFGGNFVNFMHVQVIYDNQLENLLWFKNQENYTQPNIC